jgi:hypothetical protein
MFVDPFTSPWATVVSSNRPKAGGASARNGEKLSGPPQTVIYDRGLRQMPTENVTPVAAAAAALSTLLCCLPTAFAAAIATTSAGLFVADHQGWFLGASVLLIAAGAVQVRRARATCSVARRRASAILLGVSAAIVIMTVLFPQLFAALIADWSQ